MSENDMDVDMDEQSEGNEKIQLTEMPEEIMEKILIYLDDKSLLKASHVCKLFASVAESAFARKYSKGHYEICSLARSFHKVMVNKYGEKMQNITIGENNDDKELLDLIEQKCCNVKSLDVMGPKIVVLKGLKEVYFGHPANSQRKAFAKFIDLNPQLESLTLSHIDFGLLNVFHGRLDNLKTFHWINDVLFPPAMRLSSLETLDIEMFYSDGCIRMLQSMDCNQIKELSLVNSMHDDEDDADDIDDAINTICKFEMLVSLTLPGYCVTSDLMSKLAAHLPHLTKLNVKIADEESQLVEKIPSMFPKLLKLEVRLEKYGKLLDELKNSTHDFHARFAKTIKDLTITFRGKCEITIKTDYLYVRMLRKDFVKIHWMENLNEENARKALKSGWPWRKKIKFVNNCAGRIFNISALANSEVNCLDFKSNGPISVKLNFSRYHEWFPCLNILKIHLEQHSANDFLRNLDAVFCEQIEELWLNTKRDSEDPDMTDVLAKFANLKSLHLAPSSIKCDLIHLSEVCRDLEEIKFIRL